MKKYIFIGILVCLTSVKANSGWDYRSNYVIQHSVSENYTLKLKPNYWFTGIVDELSSEHYEMGIDVKLNKWLTIFPSYRHISFINGNQHTIEHRPQIDISFKGKVNNFSLSNRNRIEYRIKQKATSIRYRAKIGVKRSLPIFNKMYFAIAEEPFYDVSTNEINKNRIYCNVGIPVYKNLSIDISYIFESAKLGNSWHNIDVLGTTLKINL